MRNPVLILTLLTATAGAAATAATQVNNFHWSRTVERGKMVDIRGVNGSVRARASGDGLVHVEATCESAAAIHSASTSGDRP